MNKFERPVTRGVDFQEKHALPDAKTRFNEFLQTNKPTVIWFDSYRSDAHSRSLELTLDERNTAILQTFGVCGITEDFYDSVRILKRYFVFGHDEIQKLTTSPFGDHKPNFEEIFNWLGDEASEWREEPNDFTVGLVIEAPKGLVVVKYSSEEPFEFESDEDEEEPFVIWLDYQVSIYPKNMAEEINWGAINRLFYTP